MPSQKDLVFESVLDHFFEKGQVCGITEVKERTKLPSAKCRDLLEQLQQEGRLTRAYQREGTPTLYIPSQVFEKVLREFPRPDWIKEFEFSEKKKVDDELRRLHEEYEFYDNIERLLYFAGKPLEKPVYIALKFIGFSNVKLLEDNQREDINFEHEGSFYVVEIYGSRDKNADKDKVNQLDGWVDKRVDEDEINTEKLKGLLVVNHQAKLKPQERSEPVTQDGIRFLKHRNYKYITTFKLYKVVKDLLEKKIDNVKAKRIIIEGEGP